MAKEGKVMAKYNKLCIGIDQSYKIVVLAFIEMEARLLKVAHGKVEQCKTNTDRRRLLKAYLDNMLKAITSKRDSIIICIIKRIRLHSQRLLNIDNTKVHIGALNSKS